MRITRLKKTGQIVHRVGAADRNGYTLCMFPYNDAKGVLRGNIQSVKNEHLVDEGVDYLDMAVKEK